MLGVQEHLVILQGFMVEESIQMKIEEKWWQKL